VVTVTTKYLDLRACLEIGQALKFVYLPGGPLE
jgi:hypothetical protein